MLTVATHTSSEYWPLKIWGMFVHFQCCPLYKMSPCHQNLSSASWPIHAGDVMVNLYGKKEYSLKFFPGHSVIFGIQYSAKKNTTSVWVKMCEPVTQVLREIIIKCNKDKILQTELFSKGQFIDPLYELHVRGNAANLGDRIIRFFYMRIDLNSQKRTFRLFCPPDWLHSHDVQGVLQESDLPLAMLTSFTCLFVCQAPFWVHLP